MIKHKQADVKKDVANKKIVVLRDFDAPVERVWEAWTDRNLLDLWWAPKPWKARTKSMDFREGGTWLYAMVGPDGEEHWSRADYQQIIPQKQFIAQDAFCDQHGTIIPDPPGMHWKSEFTSYGDTTTVRIEITFASEADLHKILEMGFEEGFKSGLNNLDEVLAGG